MDSWCETSNLATLPYRSFMQNTLWIDYVKGSSETAGERGHEPQLSGSTGVYAHSFSSSAFNSLLRLVCSFLLYPNREDFTLQSHY